MAKAYGVVYYIVNTINGKMYVGQTKNFKKRIKGHEYSDQYIDRAIKKYSWENFRCGVIKSCDSKAEMDKWEKFFIIALNTKKPIGYNLTDGGEGTNGLKPTPEYCVEMSIVRRNDSPYKNLIAEIEKQKLTYAKLAKLLKLVITSVSAKMLGRLNFTENQISKLVEIFGKPAEYLFARDDGLPTIISKHFKTPYQNLLAEMKNKKLSYSKLADLLGYNGHDSISLKMRGKIKFMAKDIDKLVGIFGKPAEYLLQRDDGKNAVSGRYKTPYKNLLAEMEKKKLSYSKIADLLGYNGHDSISLKMRCKQNFTERDKAKLAEIFGKPIDYLMFKEKF